MAKGKDVTRTRDVFDGAGDVTSRKQAEEVLLKAGALQKAIFNSANFSSIATDAKGVIQIFNVGAERMLGYAAAEVMNKITPADISDPQELIARAKALSIEIGTLITLLEDRLLHGPPRFQEHLFCLLARGHIAGAIGDIPRPLHILSLSHGIASGNLAAVHTDLASPWYRSPSSPTSRSPRAASLLFLGFPRHRRARGRRAFGNYGRRILVQ